MRQLADADQGGAIPLDWITDEEITIDAFDRQGKGLGDGKEIGIREGFPGMLFDFPAIDLESRLVVELGEDIAL